MSKFAEQFVARYGSVARLKKSTEEFKEMENSRKKDIKKQVKKMLVN